MNTFVISWSSCQDPDCEKVTDFRATHRHLTNYSQKRLDRLAQFAGCMQTGEVMAKQARLGCLQFKDHDLFCRLCNEKIEQILKTGNVDTRGRAFGVLANEILRELNNRKSSHTCSARAVKAWMSGGQFPFEACRIPIASVLGVEPDDIFESPKTVIAKEVRPSPRADDQRQSDSDLIIHDFRHLIDRASEIVGRDKLVRELQDTLLAGTPGNLLLLHGGPGIGKTGVVLKYLEKYPNSLRHFILGSEGKNSPEACLRNLCAQLIRHHLPARRSSRDLLSTYDTLPQLQNLFDKLLAEAGEELKDRTRIEIVIDGLDELPDTLALRDRNPLHIPLHPIPGIFFLVSSRQENALPHIIRESKELTADTPGHREAVRAHIRSMFTQVPNARSGESNTVLLRRAAISNRRRQLQKARIRLDDFVEVLGKKSEWNFMYVHCVLWELGQGDGDINLRELPSGLMPYYRYHWERMWNRQQCNSKLLKALFALCHGQEVPASWLREYSKLSAEEVNALLGEAWAMFLRCRDVDGVPWYTFYHKSYLEFMNKHEDVRRTYDAHGLRPTELNDELNDMLESKEKDYI